MRKFILFVFVALLLTLVACSSGEETKTDENSDQENSVSETEEETVQYEEDIELDGEQLEAAQVAKEFVNGIYSNTDFSEGASIESIEFLMNDEDFKISLREELNYLTENSSLTFDVEHIAVTEVESFQYVNHNDLSFIVNMKVYFNEQNGALENAGFVVTRYDGEWLIDWYNLNGHLKKSNWENGNDSVYVDVKDENILEAAKMIDAYIKDFLSFGHVEEINDTRGLEELWVEQSVEETREVIIASNESFLTNLEKDQRPVVLKTELIEYQEFKEVLDDRATEAYSLFFEIEYDNDEFIDIYLMTYVVVKIDGEWKIYQNSGGRVTPWTFIDYNN